MISFPLLRCELMNVCSSFIVVSIIDSFPLLPCWEIFYCWLIVVWGPCYSMLWLHTLYTVTMVSCLFYLHLIIAHEHLPISFASSSCFFSLDFNIECMIAWVPPDLYGDNHDIIDSELYVDATFHLSLMIPLYNVRVLLLF